jgi:hypothetical protein
VTVWCVYVVEFAEEGFVGADGEFDARGDALVGEIFYLVLVLALDASGVVYYIWFPARAPGPGDSDQDGIVDVHISYEVYESSKYLVYWVFGVILYFPDGVSLPCAVVPFLFRWWWFLLIFVAGKFNL